VEDKIEAMMKNDGDVLSEIQIERLIPAFRRMEKKAYPAPATDSFLLTSEKLR